MLSTLITAKLFKFKELLKPGLAPEAALGGRLGYNLVYLNTNKKNPGKAR